MPIVFQHVCDKRLREKEHLLEDIRRTINLTIHDKDMQIEHKDTLMNTVTTSHAKLWEERAQLMEEREHHFQEMKRVHETRLEDLQANSAQQQVSFQTSVAAMMGVVVIIFCFFWYLLRTQTGEKHRLETQNQQYANDIKSKIEAQKTQYESIIQEKITRIEQLEREQTQARTHKADAVATSSPHLPLVYAFPGMPNMPNMSASSGRIVHNPQVINACYSEYN